MKKIVIILSLTVLTYSSNCQTNLLYGLWTDNTTLKFVSVDKISGHRIAIANVSENLAIVQGSSTLYLDSGQYVFVGFAPKTQTFFIYALDIKDGKVKSKSVNPDNTGEYKFDPVTKKLYGLWTDDTIQKFVSVDKISGNRTEIANISENIGIVQGSSILYADSGQYIFVGFDPRLQTSFIYTINIKDGSVKSKLENPKNTGEYKFDPVTKKLYGLWTGDTIQKFVSVDKISGNRIEIASVSENIGIVQGSSILYADSGQYIFVGFDPRLQTSFIYTIDIKDGSVKSKLVNPQNTGEYKILDFINVISNITHPIEQYKVDLFPNPLNNKINLVVSDNLESIELLNSNGQILKHFSFFNNSNLLTLDISGIPNGTYLLKLIKNSGQIYTRKIIICN